MLLYEPKYEKIVKRKLKNVVGIFSLCCVSGIGIPYAGADMGDAEPRSSEQPGQSESHEKAHSEGYVLLPNHRVIKGTVEGVTEDHAKVNSGDTGEFTPRYLSLERAREKGFTVEIGDELEIVVNAKNHVVDYHLKNGASESHHRIVKGMLAQPLKVAQEHAMITMSDGEVETFAVRPLARSEVAAIPFETEALFLIDETNKIASATLTHDVVAEYDWSRSPAKNVYRHIEGVIQDIPDSHTLSIQTTMKKEDVSLPVWDYLKDDIAKLSKGMEVTLLVDGEDKVVDISMPVPVAN